MQISRAGPPLGSGFRHRGATANAVISSQMKEAGIVAEGRGSAAIRRFKCTFNDLGYRSPAQALAARRPLSPDSEGGMQFSKGCNDGERGNPPGFRVFRRDIFDGERETS